MKRLVTVIILLFIFNASYAIGDLKTIRDYYFKVNTEVISLGDYETFVAENKDENSVEWQAYKIMTWFLKAREYYNPLNKLSAFNKGKEKLDSLLSININNVELRFLRYTIQENAPSFLGYNSKIDEDKKFLLKTYPNLMDSDLKTKIISYLKKN
jgi:hypothetical protein